MSKIKPLKWYGALFFLQKRAGKVKAGVGAKDYRWSTEGGMKTHNA